MHKASEFKKNYSWIIKAQETKVLLISQMTRTYMNGHNNLKASTVLWISKDTLGIAKILVRDLINGRQVLSILRLE